jgi:hypothetical protein
LTAFGLVAALLVAALLFGGAPASGSVTDCTHGAISAVGPVDAAGRGQTVPDVRCLEP